MCETAVTVVCTGSVPSISLPPSKDSHQNNKLQDFETEPKDIDSDMENYLKDKLGCTFVKRSGKGGGGCISQGEMYHTDQGKIFVKENAREDAETMFRGEFAQGGHFCRLKLKKTSRWYNLV